MRTPRSQAQGHPPLLAYAVGLLVACSIPALLLTSLI